jgi:hypothetical protein
MAYPGPPRRTAGLARYLILAIFIVSTLVYFRSVAQDAARNSHYLDQYLNPSADAPERPNLQGPTDPSTGKGQDTQPPGFEQPQQKPADAPIEKPAEETIGNPAETPVEQPVGILVDQPAEKPASDPTTSTHPIDTLIKGADDLFTDLLNKETHNLKAAAEEYRNRRGRHPPPGFDKWFEFAQQNNAVMVEDFFDQIYHDLGPYWGLPPSTMRKESWDYDMTINIRNGNASAESHWFWTQIWLNMTQTIEHLLPDMDLPLNSMDEPRILVPWEDINDYMEKEQAARMMPPPNEVFSEFQKLDPPGEGEKDLDVETREKDWEETRMC